MDLNSFLTEEKKKYNLNPNPWNRMFGWRKRKRAEMDPGFPKNCDVCNIVLTRKFEYEAHMTGKRHMKELKKKKVREQLEKDLGAEGDKAANEIIIFDPKTNLRTCTVCSIGFTSPMIEQSHMNGKKHQKMVKISSTGRIAERPPKNGYLGRCEICAVSYTSPSLMTSHLAGKKHRKKCGKNVAQGLGGKGLEPAAKKIKLQPVITSSSIKKQIDKPVHELLEKQAEEAYEKYKSLANQIPLEKAQALYSNYQETYMAFEAAYKRYMESKGDTK